MRSAEEWALELSKWSDNSEIIRKVRDEAVLELMTRTLRILDDWKDTKWKDDIAGAMRMAADDLCQEKN